MYFNKLMTVSSAFALATILSAGVSIAQDQPTERQMKMERSGGDCMNNEDCGPTSRRNRGGDQDDDFDGNTRRKQVRDYNDDDGDRNLSRSAWRYDSSRHHRRKNRDAEFRFYFGGYYYPDRYWDEPVVVLSTRNRVSCREGRNIVDDSGFNRVRTIECSGRNFTYKARRHGDDFRVVLNSRNGRIVSVREL